MWKCVLVRLSYLVTLCNSGSVEVWKCRNVSWLSLSSNSGSVDVWKCGNTVCLRCLYLITGGGHPRHIS